ncbi:translation machinery-associated protein 16 [Elasticomyces elasticus]|nr:translation machinery-associated protein 16 [Elasticomyces elasticus]KAK4985464.1 translation machinery-associated protein 16 [Elasticomyces elasticus]
MPSKLAKVQKHITKKKGSKANALHENSRDAQRLRTASARDEKVARLTAVREKTNQPLIERVAFFQDHVELIDTARSADEQTREIIASYLGRTDDELAALVAERRPGRPPSTRQPLLEQSRKTEQREYESGFWCPDMKDPANLAALEKWGRDWSSLARIKFIRVPKVGGIRESAFPPKGAS